MTARNPIPTAPLTDDGRAYSTYPTGDDPRRGNWRNLSWGWWLALALGAAVIIIGAALLFGGDAPAETQTASVADIVDDPAALMDDRVVVTGRIEELLTDRALAIGSDTAADDVLVLLAPTALIRGYGLGTTTGIPLPVGETYEQGDVVQFAGTLREFDREALSEDLGLVLNDELFDSWSDDPALVIDRLDVATVGRPLLLETAAPA